MQNPRINTKIIFSRFVHLFGIFAISFIALYINRYQFGVGDQIIHIPYIKDLLNGNLYPKDLLVETMYGKPTYFWPLFIPLFKIFGLENGTFVLQISSLFLFLYMVKTIVSYITKNDIIGYLAVIFFIFEKHSFGYSSLFVLNHFIPRNFTIPIVIYAVYLYMRGKRGLGYLTLGLISNLHVLSILPVLFSFSINDLIDLFSKKGNKVKEKITSITGYILMFTLGAIPLLAKFVRFFSVNTEMGNINYIYQDFYDSVLTPMLQIETKFGWLMFMNAILIIVFSWIYLSYVKEISNQIRNYLRILLGAGAFLVFISLIFEVLPVNPFLLQLQLGRSAEFSLLIFIMALSHSIYFLYVENKRTILGMFAILLGILFSNISILLAITGLKKIKMRANLAPLLSILGIIFLMQFINEQMGNFREVKPNIQLNVQSSENVDAQLWLKNNTTSDAVVLAPYYIGGFTEPDFRTISERTNILTNADIVETILNKDLLFSTINKINDLSQQNYNTLKVDDRLFDYYVERDLYHSAVINSFNFLVSKYGIKYVVIESDYELPAKQPVYENTKYKIYSTI